MKKGEVFHRGPIENRGRNETKPQYVLRIGQHGSVMVEAAVLFLFFAGLVSFILDLGLTLHHESQLSNTSVGLVRRLSVKLGKAWSSKEIEQAPWNGNCDAYLRAAGDAYLSGVVENPSMSNPAAKYYFGATLDDNKALVPVSGAPFAVLRVVGRMTSTPIFGFFLPPQVFDRESSMLVEFNAEACSDY
jgi:hypothetical protein